MSIITHLEWIEDPRTDVNIKHNLVDVLFLTLSAVLSGADGWKSIQEFGELQLDWLRQHRPFEHGIPKRHCIANIIKALNTDALLKALLDWINSRREEAQKPHIAIDGKVLRGCWKDNVYNALNVVSAFDVDNGLALYQQAAKNKGQEGQIARDIIDILACKGCIVTLDALHCQTKTLESIVKNKGDFIIQVKANQRNLHDAIAEHFKTHYDSMGSHEEAQSNCNAHGRGESRLVMQLPIKLPQKLKEKWPHVKTVIEVARGRKLGDKTSYTSHFYVSSLAVEPELVAKAIREHWHIENRLHWVLDVVFKEDKLKVADPDGAAHIALFNRVCLNIIRQHQSKKDSLAAKRRGAAWNGDFRTELLFG
ncbi:ISAs1 family transposase [Pseudoalteromonas piscicida]